MPKFIFAADLHLRKSVPKCRKETEDEWFMQQWKQLNFIVEKAIEYGCDVLLGGDTFHTSIVQDEIKNMFINAFSTIKVSGIAGQHDLPEHSWRNLNKSSYGVLKNTDVLPSPSICSYCHFGTDIVTVNDEIMLVHELVFENAQKIPPNVRAKTAEQMLDEYPKAKWILCGDQHHGFYYQKGKRHVIMAGCMNRQAADFIDYEPCIWYIDTESDEVVRILIPDDRNMISDKHIKDKDERTDRISAFVSLIKDAKAVSLDFDENVRNGIISNPDLPKDVVNVIEELMNT